MYVSYLYRLFLIFCVSTNIYNKKTKWPTLMELFTATGKQKKIFSTTRDVRCVHHGWHGTHQYDIQVLATHTSTWVHRYSSLLLWSVPKGLLVINICNHGEHHDTLRIITLNLRTRQSSVTKHYGTVKREVSKSATNFMQLEDSFTK
jgi:hypothetical protein